MRYTFDIVPPASFDESTTFDAVDTFDKQLNVTFDSSTYRFDTSHPTVIVTFDNVGTYGLTFDSTTVGFDYIAQPISVEGSFGGYFDALYWAHPYFEHHYWAHFAPVEAISTERIGYWASPYWSHHYFGDPYWGGAVVSVDVEFVPYGQSKKKRPKTRRGKGFKNVPKSYAKPYTTKPSYVERPRAFGQWIDLDKRDEERRLAALQIELDAQARAQQAALQAEDDAWVILTAIALDEDESCELVMPDIPAEHREAVSLLIALAQL